LCRTSDRTIAANNGISRWSHFSELAPTSARFIELYRKDSFENAFRRLLKKYDVDFDERYVWD
jgi:hypothetical protein